MVGSRRRCCGAAWGVVVCVLVGCGQTEAFTLSAPPKTVVFLVHGTYGGTSRWVNVVEGKCTFASEVRRGLGGDVVIVPFLWRSSVKHEARVTAAERLAKQLDRPEYDGRRVVVIAHSHGGNVALEAAGHCRRAIGTLICLATPQMYLLSKDSDDKPLALPIYCSPRARRQIGRIITITPANDPVVNWLAQLRQGIDEQTALTWTYDWRKRLGDPRLVDDSDAIGEWLEDVLKLTSSGNLAVGWRLSIADENISVVSVVQGLRCHRTIHSARVGWLLGRLLRDGISQEQLSYFRSLVIPADADDGSPLDLDLYKAWWAKHLGDIHFSGWLLKEIRITGTKDTKPARPRSEAGYSYWDVDHSWPDVSFRIYAMDDAEALFESDCLMDEQTVVWRPLVHLARGSALRVVVIDKDLVFDDEMGSFVIEASGAEGPPSSYGCEQFKVGMVWRKVHY